MGSLRRGQGRSRGVQGPLEAMGEWEGQGCFVLRSKGLGGENGTQQKFTGPHEVRDGEEVSL